MSVDGEVPEWWRMPDARYMARGPIGTGALGEVVRAYDRLLQRDVAVKTLRPGVDGAEARTRMLREARLTATLEHPNILPIYDVGYDTAGVPRYTMREIHGDTLDATVRATPALAGRLALLRAFVGACHGVAYAHEHGVIHRDLSPRNIILGAFGEAVVIDWGLATRIGPEAEPPDGNAPEGAPESTVPRTLLGAVLGTPGYMSPEAAMGGPLTPASDIFGLGAILYFLVAGEAPYGGSVGTILADTATTPIPVLPPQRAPRPLASILLRATALAPADRYPSATALADDLSAFIEGRRVRAHRYSAAERLRALIARRTGEFVTGAVAAVMLVGGGVGGASYAARLDAAAAQADREAKLQTALAEGLQAADHLADDRYSEAAGAAAAALAVTENPDIRGTLIAAARAWLPTLVRTIAAPSCEHVAVSPDGTYAACIALSDVTLLDVATGAIVTTVHAAGQLRGVPAFSDDGRRLAVSTVAPGIAVWSVPELNPLHVYSDEGRAPLHEVAWIPGRDALVGASEMNDIVLFRAGHAPAWVTTGQTLIRGGGREGPRVYVGSTEGMQVLSADGAASEPFLSSEDATDALVIPDGNAVVLGSGFASGNDRVTLRRLDHTVPDLTRRAPGGGLVGMLGEPGGARVLLESLDGHAELLWTSTLGPAGDIATHALLATHGGFLPTQDQLLLPVRGSPVALQVYQLPPVEPPRRIRIDDTAVLSVAASPDGRYIASASQSGAVRVYDWRTGTQVRAWDRPAHEAHALAWTRAGLAVSGGDGALHLYDPAHDSPVDIPGDVGTNYMSVAQGDTLYATGNAAEVTTWDLATRTLRGAHHLGSSGAGVIVGPDRVVAVDYSGTWRTFSRDLATELAPEWSPAAVIWGVPVGSADGSEAVYAGHTSGAENVLVRISLDPPHRVAWSVAIPTRQSTLRWTADGVYIVGTGLDGDIRIWSATDGTPRATVRGHDGQIWGAALIPTTRVLVTGGADGELHLWNLEDAWAPVAPG